MGQERGCKFARRWWNCFLDLSQGSLCNWFFQVRAFLSLGLSHCSKDMKQWTSVTARLQLKLLLSRQQIIHTPVRGEGRRTLKKWSQPVSAPPVDTFLSPSPRAWLVLPYAKWGLHRPSVRKVVFFSHWRFPPQSLEFPLLSFSQAFSFLRLPFSCQCLTTVLDSPFSTLTA